MLIILCLLVIIFLLSLFCVYIIYKYINQKKDLELIHKTANKIRYGDINIRVKNMKNRKLEDVFNRLIETIYDREIMIREYQNTLSKKNLTLEEVLKQEKKLQLFKEEFAATLTHDMKVPVIAELNSIEYLLEGRFGELNSKQTEVLNLMKSSNLELKDLIENMLETYRLEQTNINLNMTNHRFNEFLLPIIKEMSMLAFKSDHKITYSLEESEGLNIDFDELQLKRVIKNLIQNAISFSPNGSKINIYTQKTDKKIKFIISNKGNNISEEDLALIFQKYYTGHSKFRKAGTGLGLYLSQQIALAHGGNISVDNEKESITTFILTLPLN